MLSLTWCTTSTQQMPAGSTDAPGAPFNSHTKNARAVASSINAMCKRMHPKRARADTHMPAFGARVLWPTSRLRGFYLALCLRTLTLRDWRVKISQSCGSAAVKKECAAAGNWAAAANIIGAERIHVNIFFQRQTVYILLFWTHEFPAMQEKSVTHAFLTALAWCWSFSPSMPWLDENTSFALSAMSHSGFGKCSKKITE